MRILHLSDTHVTQVGGRNADGIDPRQSLRRMLGDCAYLGPVDMVVVSGDVADDGSPTAYADVARMVGDFATASGAAQVYCMGNHDLRRNFAQVLGSGHLGIDGEDRGQLADSVEDERAAVSEVAGYRLITLDTSVPGKGYGWVSDAQLTWLARTLATPSGSGTVIVMHHPPIALDVPVQQALMLRNAPALAAAIDGSDVRVVLCGHFHLQLNGWLGRSPVVVSPGVLNRVDLTCAPQAERAICGASATVVELAAAQPPMSYLLHARDPEVGRTAYELSADELTGVIARLGPERVAR